MKLGQSEGDHLLRWASEREAGAWNAFREAAASVASQRGLNVRPWQVANKMSALGHMDIDWESDKWSVAPPCIALSPGMGMWAYLAGWRTVGFLQRYDEATDDLGVFPDIVDQGLAPRAFFAKYGSIDALEEVARRLYVPVIYDPAAQLADMVSVPGVEGLSLAAGPPPDEEIERFDTNTLRWNHSNPPHSDGMHRFDLYGKKEFLLLHNGSWFHTDRSVGQMAVLRDRNDILVWHRASSDFRHARVLAVRSQVTLPAVAERAAVAASGLLPEWQGDWRVYRNVTRPTADRIARGLGLELGTGSDHFKIKRESKR